MSIFKTLAVKDVAEATRAIPLIDVGPAFDAGPDRREAVAARGAARLRERSASSTWPATACRRR